MNTFAEKFVQNFVEESRYMYLLKGLGNTFIITIFAVLIGVFLGFLVAIIRSTADKTGKLKILDTICRVYLTIIRGTPAMIQLLIMFYVVFANSNNKIFTAIMTFGINSGAYVAEIVRGGIMSIDNGQFEAGRSIGFNYPQTMYYIIMPQVFKNVLPALVNEFIVLLKETAIVGYVGMSDLTRVANQLTSTVFEAFTPLIGAAVIYFIIIKILTKLLEKLERRLRKSDNR